MTRYTTFSSSPLPYIATGWVIRPLAHASQGRAMHDTKPPPVSLLLCLFVCVAPFAVCSPTAAREWTQRLARASA